MASGQELIDRLGKNWREAGIHFRDHRWLYDEKNKCPKPWDEVYISNTGDVVPCCTIADPRVACMGNIFEQSFEEIWNDDRYVEFRDSLLTNNIRRCCNACYNPDALVEKHGAVVRPEDIGIM